MNEKDLPPRISSALMAEILELENWILKADADSLVDTSRGMTDPTRMKSDGQDIWCLRVATDILDRLVRCCQPAASPLHAQSQIQHSASVVHEVKARYPGHTS